MSFDTVLEGNWMVLLFLSGAVWLAYVYVGYLVMLVIVSRWIRVRPNNSSTYMPSVSVLIAARNEEKDIGWKIVETLAWDYPVEKLDILVASDASDDTTDEIVRRFAGPRVTLIRMERRGGKARALNRLAELASGQVLFFTDANAHIAPHVLRLMVRHFADPRVGCVTGDSRPIKDHDNPALTHGAEVYWGYETMLKRLESNIGSVLVCDGAIFCMRASLFESLHPELANDLESPMRVGGAGYWVIDEPRGLVFEHETTSALEELRRRRRICAQGMLAMLKLHSTFSGLRGWQFLSHKFLRWLSFLPMLMVLAASSALATRSIVFRFLLVPQVLFYGFAAIGFGMILAGRKVPRPLAVPFYAVLGMLGALMGVVASLLGRRFDVWEIPILSRRSADVSFFNAAGD
jgi:cellulose synthase/poly-beta-1,6-N-acetylglucosamine synthase-like glycosyltransferase